MNTKLTKLVSPLYHIVKSSTQNYFQTEHRKSHYNLNQQQGNIKTSCTSGKRISQEIQQNLV